MFSKVTGAHKVAASAGGGVLSGIGGQPALQTSALRIATFEKTVSIRTFVDSSFVESYFNNGRVAMTTSCWQPTKDPFASCDLKVAEAFVFASGAPVRLLSAKVWSVGSVWVSAETVRATPRID